MRTGVGELEFVISAEDEDFLLVCSIACLRLFEVFDLNQEMVNPYVGGKSSKSLTLIVF